MELVDSCWDCRLDDVYNVEVWTRALELIVISRFRTGSARFTGVDLYSDRTSAVNAINFMTGSIIDTLELR